MHRDAVPLVSHKESGSAVRRGCQDRRRRTYRPTTNTASTSPTGQRGVGCSFPSVALAAGKADGFLLPVCSNGRSKAPESRCLASGKEEAGAPSTARFDLVVPTPQGCHFGNTTGDYTPVVSCNRCFFSQAGWSCLNG